MTEQTATVQPMHVKDNIFMLRNLTYMLSELTKIECGWIPGTALWELKLHLARCQWEDACQADEMRHRIQEFRSGNPDRNIHPQVITLINVTAAAPDGASFFQGLFHELKPYLIRLLNEQLNNTDALCDNQTQHILDQTVVLLNKQITTADLHFKTWKLDDRQKTQADEWQKYIHQLIEEIDVLTEDSNPPKLRSLKPYEPFRPSPIALRDDRFKTSFGLEPPINNLQDEATIYEVKIVANYFKEMMATETVATSLYETKGMPWQFYYETSRHCWDEARHCMIGQRRLEQLGFDITDVKMAVGNYAVRQLLDPLYRYTYITMIEEAGSMKIKRENIIKLEQMGKTLTARLGEYDLADEINHVNYGYRWIPEILKVRGDSRLLEQVVEEAVKLRNQAFELIKIDLDNI